MAYSAYLLENDGVEPAAATDFLTGDDGPICDDIQSDFTIKCTGVGTDVEIEASGGPGDGEASSTWVMP